MKIFVKKGKLADTKSQAIILPLFEENKKLSGTALEIDKISDGLISELISNGDFEAKPSQISVIYTRGSLPSQRIALAGLGKQNEFNPEKLRGAFAKVMQHLRNLNIKEAATEINLDLLPRKKDQVAQAVAEGSLLGLYQYTPFKTVGREDLKEMKQLTIVADEKDFSLIESTIKKAQMITQAVCFARDLISAPSNEMTPAIMAQKAQEIAHRKNVSCRVLN
ncbi:MAG: M17 family peptidase N-terminal domain-containing protein, partial [Smithella sp.]